MLKNKWILYFFGFVIISILVGNLNKDRKKKLLSKNTQIVKGIFTRSFTQINTGIFSIFKSQINHQEIYLEIYDYRDFLFRGDTVLIKYSLEDPTVAEVIDFCYMQKHKGKCK
jgi:hypothetical protein